jgi:hypothetical protein
VEEVSKLERIPVEVGQIWQDNDKRAGERRLKVVHVGAARVSLRDLDTGRGTQVAVSRMVPTSTGYRLVRNADGSAA